MEETNPYYWKSMSINFPEFPHTMSFVVFFRTVITVWENACISHMVNYTIGWGSNGKDEPIL